MSKEIDELLDAHRAWLGITVFASAGAVFLVTERLRRAKAALESQAKDHAEALVIAHGMGAASRNGEVRALALARKDAESRLWDSQRLKDNYSGELKVVIGERDAAKALVADAQDYVREIIEENAANWGERLMHKQQPAIDCDAAITAFLEGK